MISVCAQAALLEKLTPKDLTPSHHEEQEGLCASFVRSCATNKFFCLSEFAGRMIFLFVRNSGGEHAEDAGDDGEAKGDDNDDDNANADAGQEDMEEEEPEADAEEPEENGPGDDVD